MKRVTLVLAVIAVGMTPAFAYNPPTDTAGPLTVRIVGPEKVNASETPFPFTVELSNNSDAAIQGTLRIQLADAWRIEPAEPVPVSLEARATMRLEFKVIAGKGSYSAGYPIHAFAEVEAAGAKYTAHAVQIVNAQLSDAPRAATAVPWQLINVQSNSVLSLLRSPIYRAVIQVFGADTRTMATGWHGVDGKTCASMDPGTVIGRPDVRESLGIHPPWCQGQTGTLWVEYPLQLPASTPLVLRFANALRDITEKEPPSDGVTFRVRVAAWDAPDGTPGEVVFERHTDAKVWQDAEVDLSAFAGKTVRLQLESHPGPKNDTTCDACFWGAPQIVAGSPTPSEAVKLSESKSLGSIQTGGVGYEAGLRLGERGVLDGEIVFTAVGQTLSFRGFCARVLGDQLEERSGITEFLGFTDESDAAVTRIRHQFRNWLGAFDLVAELSIADGKALQVRFRIENGPEPRPWQVVYIEDLAAGPWSDAPHRIYAGVGNVVCEPKAFDLPYDSHQLATSFVGFEFGNGTSIVQSVDVPPSRLSVRPESRLASLHTPLAQTMNLIPAPNVWAAAKSYRELDTRKASGGVAMLNGRFVFDLWGGGYKASAEALKKSFQYGLTHSVVVWHNWQRWGYDYRLPDIYPPNPDLGTTDEFGELAAVCKAPGVVFAPHDNYIDLYPDAQGFTYKNVAFSRDGDPTRAWFNEGRGAQSYRWRTDAYRPFMEANVNQIKESFHPTGYFIDVFSSIGPYESWTSEGVLQDRVFTRNTWGETFAWIRTQLGDNAPQISEGGHDQLIGYLDGSQANHLRVDADPPKDGGWMVWRIKCADAERIPWFDVAYHDRFVPHGAGYSVRYQGGLDAPLHGIYSDDYIASEVMTGHPPMVSEPFGRDVVRKYWLLHGLANRLAAKLIDSVEFVDNDIHRQHIRYAGGADEVWINRGPGDWEVQGKVLPQYGFLASENGSPYAGIVRSDAGTICEWSCAATPHTESYVNARPLVTAKLPVNVTCDAIRYAEGRTFEMALNWDASKPLAQPLNVFAHFVDADGKILFQADHALPVSTTQRKGTVQTKALVAIPASIAAGTSVELRVGLWRQDIGRQPLPGFMDGECRVRLGTLTIEGQGGAISGVMWSALEPKPDPVAARMNPEEKDVAFFDGTVVTNGAFWLTENDGTLQITPLPQGPAFKVRLAKAMFAPERVPNWIQELDETGRACKTSPLRSEGDWFVLNCEPSVFAYRLSK